MSANSVSHQIEISANRSDPTIVGHALLASAGFAEVQIVSFETLWGGNPAKSQNFRVSLSNNIDGSNSAIVKLPAGHRAKRDCEISTATYAREIEVYKLLKDFQGQFLPLVYGTVYDQESSTAALLLEDLGSLPQRSEFDLGAIRRVLKGLANIHRRFWQEAGIGNAWWIRDGDNADIFDEDVALFEPNWGTLSSDPELHPHNVDVVNKVGDYLCSRLPTILSELNSRPKTLTHGDLHTANVMFRRNERGVEPVLIDWQDAVYSGASSDVAKFLSTTLSTEQAERHFDDLITCYYRNLGCELRNSYRFADFRRDVMLALLGTFANYVIAANTNPLPENASKTVNTSLRRVSTVISVVKPLETI